MRGIHQFSYIKQDVMKTKTLSILALMLVLSYSTAFAQIPNNGFEEWITVGNCQKPVGWYGTNDFTDTLSNYFGVTRSTDHNPASVGNYSVRIQNNLDQLPDWPAFGILWSGGASGSDYPAFAIPLNSSSFCGYYKFLPENNDTMRIALFAYNHGEEVFQVMLESSEPAPEWTPFCLIFPDMIIDSGRIMLSSFYPEGELTIHGNSVLYADNLSFDNLITSTPVTVNEFTAVDIFPNPVADKLMISLPDNQSGQITLDVFNMTGKQVLSRQVKASSAPPAIDVSSLAAGNYFLRITTNTRAVFIKDFIITR